MEMVGNRTPEYGSHGKSLEGTLRRPKRGASQGRPPMRHRPPSNAAPAPQAEAPRLRRQSVPDRAERLGSERGLGARQAQNQAPRRLKARLGARTVFSRCGPLSSSGISAAPSLCFAHSTADVGLSSVAPRRAGFDEVKPRATNTVATTEPTIRRLIGHHRCRTD
jgi:hypothetical protein